MVRVISAELISHTELTSSGSNLRRLHYVLFFTMVSFNCVQKCYILHRFSAWVIQTGNWGWRFDNSTVFIRQFRQFRQFKFLLDCCVRIWNVEKILNASDNSLSNQAKGELFC